MKINLLIVDDRKEIVEQIAKAVQWKQYDISASTAHNGQDALQLLLQRKIDIVITDIEMPFLSGLKLAEECKNNKLATKIIILSGYDNFSYAKQALSLGVCEYLLKPVSMETLLQTVLKVKEQLKQEHLVLENVCRQHRREMQSLPMLKEAFFEELLSSDTNWEWIWENAELLNLEISLKQICMVLLDPVWTEGDRASRKNIQSFQFGIANMAKEIFSKQFSCEVFNAGKSMVAVALNYAQEEKPLVIQYHAYQSAHQLQQAINEYYDIDITTAISGCCGGENAFKHAYQECVGLLNSGFYEQKNTILSKSDEIKHQEPIYPEHLAEDILRAFSLSDLEKALEMTSRLCSEMMKVRKYPPVELKNKLCNLLIKIGYTKGIESNVFELSSEFLELSTMQEVEQWMCSHIQKMFVKCEEKQNPDNRIDAVQAYIEENYHRPISLKELSESLYISQSYLSTLFKEHIGMNFSQYLTNLRIEKAKKLLQNNQYKIYEIAEMVGYADTRYFSETFRKNTGFLPKQWVKQQNKQ